MSTYPCRPPDHITKPLSIYHIPHSFFCCGSIAIRLHSPPWSSNSQSALSRPLGHFATTVGLFTAGQGGIQADRADVR